MSSQVIRESYQNLVVKILFFFYYSFTCYHGNHFRKKNIYIKCRWDSRYLWNIGKIWLKNISEKW